ncbi:proline-rich receptor-like protein kinase PERK8 [Monomorium pharaonis]|uniref:proline-rich receptor-like protein kinase PERK8 n=1 Tax=Monomorium pharaonis TaxID=307658 RepID=UPI00063F3CEE|nr:proline-rich receptor-like protein kinase PERK8 [Monomorium pharaonis]
MPSKNKIGGYIRRDRPTEDRRSSTPRYQPPSTTGETYCSPRLGPRYRTWMTTTTTTVKWPPHRRNSAVASPPPLVRPPSAAAETTAAVPPLLTSPPTSLATPGYFTRPQPTPTPTPTGYFTQSTPPSPTPASPTPTTPPAVPSTIPGDVLRTRGNDPARPPLPPPGLRTPRRDQAPTRRVLVH